MASFALTFLTAAALTMIKFISESAIRERMDDRAELKTTQKCDFDGSLYGERSGSTVSSWRWHSGWGSRWWPRLPLTRWSRWGSLLWWPISRWFQRGPRSRGWNDNYQSAIWNERSFFALYRTLQTCLIKRRFYLFLGFCPSIQNADGFRNSSHTLPGIWE